MYFTKAFRNDDRNKSLGLRMKRAGGSLNCGPKRLPAIIRSYPRQLSVDMVAAAVRSSRPPATLVAQLATQPPSILV